MLFDFFLIFLGGSQVGDGSGNRFVNNQLVVLIGELGAFAVGKYHPTDAEKQAVEVKDLLDV